MADNTTQFGKHQATASEQTTVTKAVVPQAAAKTVQGQKYVSPLGRHSQQTHRRAEAREVANGYTSEKEMHAHDRQTVEAEIDRAAQAKATQRAQNARKA
jgi:hypothetical protein